MYNTDLRHSGVKGMHWGVRRYQNPDGSLTAEGYQHYGINMDGSRYRVSRRQPWAKNTVKSAKKGFAVGLGAGAAVGFAVGGPTGAAVGALVGHFTGSTVGSIAGAIDTSRKRKKINKLLSEKGKVYVKDL